jgi:hypothetical protein
MLILWMLSQRSGRRSSRDAKLKLLRVIEVHDIVLFEKGSIRLRQAARKNAAKKSALLSSPMKYSGRTRPAMFSSSAPTDDGSGSRQRRRNVSTKEFLLAFSFLTFDHMVSDDVALRDTTMRLWKSMLIHDEVSFLDMIGAKKLKGHRYSIAEASVSAHSSSSAPSAANKSAPTPKATSSASNILSRLSGKARGDLFVGGFDNLLRDDMNRFSLWLASEMERVGRVMSKRPAKAYK